MMCPEPSSLPAKSMNLQALGGAHNILTPLPLPFLPLPSPSVFSLASTQWLAIIHCCYSKLQLFRAGSILASPRRSEIQPARALHSSGGGCCLHHLHDHARLWQPGLGSPWRSQNPTCPPQSQRLWKEVWQAVEGAGEEQWKG